MIGARDHRILALLICILLSASALMAQSNSSITGTLTDQAGATVPNATLTVTETSTRAQRTAQTNETGLFRVLNLLPGRYTVRIEAAGFKLMEINDIVLASTETRDLGKLSLAIGAVSEQVAVTAESTPVQTATSERGALVDGTQLNDVALKGRDTFGMLALIPGVVDGNADRSLAAPGSSDQIFINGAGAAANNMQLDGVNQVDMGSSRSVYVNPSVDAISEVRVLTNGFQAEYGRNSGGTMNMVTKSGTRDFHGSAYWQRRHEGMNANNFFNNRSNIQRPIYRYFIGGATIGGPVFIPNRFNREKGKLFFFWSEEFTRVAQPTQTATANLPTTAERSGDFSNTLNSAGALITIKDPTTGAAFPGNIIPTARIDTTGQGMLSLFDKPNGYVNPAAGQRYTANYLASATPTYRRRDDIVRVDYNVAKNMMIYGRYAHDLSDTLYVFTTAPGMGKVLNGLPGTSVSVHAMNIIRPTLVNEVNIGIGRNSYKFARAEGDANSNYYRSTALNPPVLRPLPKGEEYEPYLPAASYSGGAASNPGVYQPYLAVGNTSAPNFPIPSANYNRTYSVQDDLSKVAGRHNLKTGVYFELNSKYEPSIAGKYYPGTFNFGSSTNNPLDSGHGYSNALLGIFQTYTESTNRVGPKGVFRQTEFYVQDNWRVSDRFTLDFGVRFYKIGLPYDTTEPRAYANFYPQLWKTSAAPRLYFPTTVAGKNAAIDRLTGATAVYGLVGTIVPGTGSAVNGISINGLTGKGDFAEFPFLVTAPRLGFAWNISGDGKTALRASFGTFYNRPNAGWLPGRGAAPVVYDQSVYSTTISQIPAAAAAAAISPVVGTSVTGTQKVQRSTQWNITLQHAVGFATVVDIGYVGNLDRNAPVARQINPVPLGAYSISTNLFNNGAINAALLRTTYPGLGSITYTSDGMSDLNYHGFQLAANRRMTRNLQYGVSYVFSKALGTVASDPYHVDRSWFYGPLTQDRSHVLNMNWVYRIPSVSNHKVAKAVLGDWTLSGIVRFSTGAPLSPVCSAATGAVSVTDPSLTGVGVFATNNLGGYRCKVVGDSKAYTQSFFQNFNTAAFALADPGTFGTSGYNTLRQPTTSNLDATLDKRIPIGSSERRVVRLRLEAYNILNHTEFSTIGATMSLSGATNLNTQYGQYTATLPARVLSTTIRFEF